ncbi:MAG: ATP-binding cassette domain-containing protein [Syntrophales bacterium]|jgi:tungstate transport system ATP-binding protein|nr:ATP-binding cassette domain-containing protein [Syntrophales bacterium]MDY0044979.1 ATP-binding cassette domain-containing protein [Syntrophales bacterium]
MESRPLYELADVVYRYGDHFELAVPNLSIPAGSSIGVTGPNGGGKTTLLKLLSFIEKPYKGTIFFDGRRIREQDHHVTREITILFQEPYLLKRTVFDNVAYGLKVRNERGNITAKVRGALNLVGLPYTVFAKRQWFELSGGEAQRVALASRLILNPRVLILDEPTASVDQESALLINEAVRSFREKYGTTLIVASHDRIWLSTVTDSIMKVRKGRLESFDPENLIPGPWIHTDNGLHTKALSDGRHIKALSPPGKQTTGYLRPADIVVATNCPSDLSTQNILEGIITQMTFENNEKAVFLSASVAELSLSCKLTQAAVEKLRLFPGKKVWLLFKASSFRWH